jgi:peptidoglycan/xylan/chitin deacetylase (PgdA/CDA1 family)
MKIKIFLFHRVNPVRDPLWDPIDPLHFRKVISYLKNHFDIFKLEDMILNPQDYKLAKKPLAAIVFDDGYRDFIDYALPILQEFNSEASMYIITDSASNGTPPWTYILDYTFQKSNKLKGDFDISGLPKELQVLAWKNNDERISYGKKLKPVLKKFSHQVRALFLQQVHTCFDDVKVPTDLFMTWKDINEVYNSGIEIGSHTVTHPLLGTIEDESTLEFEIKTSANVIQKNIGKLPLAISYPVGSYNEKVKRISQETGYLLGLAVNQHGYNSSVNDNFAIPRIELYNEGMFKTKLRMKEVVYKINHFLKRST